MRLIILIAVLTHYSTCQDYGSRSNNSIKRSPKPLVQGSLPVSPSASNPVRATNVKVTNPGIRNPNLNQQDNQPYHINGLADQNPRGFSRNDITGASFPAQNFRNPNVQNNVNYRNDQNFQGYPQREKPQEPFQNYIEPNIYSTLNEDNFSPPPSTPVSTLPTSPIPVGPETQLEFELEDAWEQFKREYNKFYPTLDEEYFRKEIFIENKNKIENFNEDYSSGKSTYVKQINSYADLLAHDFNLKLNGFNRSLSPPLLGMPRGSFFVPSANVEIPDRIDWRELGAVTPIKDQQKCAGCFAFSAAGAIEGQTFRKTNTLKELSPQNLIDCTKPYGNNGCSGGNMEPAFQYVKENPGINTESGYPYESIEGPACRYKREDFAADDTGFVSLPSNDENALKIAVATLGPISVAMHATSNLQFYKNGIYFDEKCKIDKLNHAVLVVGYGVEQDGKEYWLIKNSYGMSWGIGGYLKLARNVKNHCGVASLASYPLV